MSKLINTAKKMIRCHQLGSTDMALSVLGMGGSGFGNVYGRYNEQDAIEAVHHAIDRGINYFDTAYWYGQGTSESFLGKALKGIARNRFYIASKVGRYERDIPNMFDFTAEKVTRSAEESLKRLQLDYVDILQVHDVEFAPSLEMIINETLPAVEKLKKRGLCRYIGITGYPLGPLKEIVERSHVKIDSVLSYCRLTLNDSSLQNEFAFFKSKGVPVINASPVSMGLLTPAGVQSWHPGSDAIKKACAESVKYCASQGVDIIRLAINYTCSFDEVTTTLVSMNDKAIVDANIDAVCRPLTDKEMEVRDYIMKHYYEPLETRDWEGVEVPQYWAELAKAT